MDSITQLALGAALGEAVAGKKVGHRAPLWGAICGTIPDLDTFYPFADPVSAFTYHRGYSHSLFVLALLSPLITWLIVKVHSDTAEHWRAWWSLAALALLTHPILDAFTVYGTQLLLPFSDLPVAFSTIFVIDPAYTLPLIVGVLCALWLRHRPAEVSAPVRIGVRERGFVRKANTIGLCVSTVYLLCTIGVKLHVNSVVEESLKRWDMPQAHYLATPAPFNVLLWRVLALDEGRYIETFYSVLDRIGPVEYIAYPTEHRRINALGDEWSVQRLRWFTRGFYRVREQAEGLWVQDLRMGVFDQFVFSFKVADVGAPTPQPVAVVQAPRVQPTGELLWAIIRRIWQPISPPALAAQTLPPRLLDQSRLPR